MFFLRWTVPFVTAFPTGAKCIPSRVIQKASNMEDIGHRTLETTHLLDSFERFQWKGFLPRSWGRIFSCILLGVSFANAWQIEPSQGKPIALKKDTVILVTSAGSLRITDPASRSALLLRLVVPDGKVLLRWVGPPELLAGTEGVQVVRKDSEHWRFLSRGKPAGMAFREVATPVSPGSGGGGVTAQQASRLVTTMLSTSTRGGDNASAGEPVSPPDLSQAYQGWKLPAASTREAKAWALFRQGRDLDATRLALKAVDVRPDNFASAEVLLSTSNDREVRRLVDSAVQARPALAKRLAIALLRTGVRRSWAQWMVGWKDWGDAYAVARYACEEWIGRGEMSDETTRRLSQSPLAEIALHPKLCGNPGGLLYSASVTDSTNFERELLHARVAADAGDTAGLAKWVGWSARYPQSGRAAVQEARIRLLRNTPDALAFAEKILERVLDDNLAREVEARRGGSHEDFLLWLGERHTWAESL